MMGSLSRAGVWFVVLVGFAVLVKVSLWLVGCSVVDALRVGPDSKSCLDLGMETS